jgi:hypothetical protein
MFLRMDQSIYMNRKKSYIQIWHELHSLSLKQSFSLHIYSFTVLYFIILKTTFGYYKIQETNAKQKS